tara:strand:- start:81 stop:455 length:375 start_codon:yes stop_codon:yes gene_type:complete
MFALMPLMLSLDDPRKQQRSNGKRPESNLLPGLDPVRGAYVLVGRNRHGGRVVALNPRTIVDDYFVFGAGGRRDFLTGPEYDDPDAKEHNYRHADQRPFVTVFLLLQICVWWTHDPLPFAYPGQ